MVARKREYRRLSRRTRVLLLGTENSAVDFKRNANGVKQKSLVAFANSEEGGALLLGVEEFTSEDGVQRGRIVGCDVDDGARLQIQNKALGCIPPVHIEIITENLAHKPILRIEIRTGSQRPYCTSSGEYAIRADGRNRVLQPSEMLQLFMDRESEQFLNRFKYAVSKLEAQVEAMDGELKQGVDRMISDIMRLDHDTSYILNELYGRSLDIRKETDIAKKHDSDLERKLKNIKQGQERKYKHLRNRIGDIELKIDALLEHFAIADPIQLKARDHIIEMTQMIQNKNNEGLLADFLDVLRHIYPDIEPEQLSQWVSEALDEANLKQ
ncbi:MAG: ATP-binding protein [Pseudomonadales bacterium]|nr:ATP-binding protein [Pseudomonadales bacterium]